VLEAEIEEFVHRVMDELFRNTDWMSKVSLLAQEHETIITVGHGTSVAVSEAVKGVLAGWKVPANTGK
jgi:fructoselysine-6-P-deglycase FrlB-like protein